MSMSETTVIPQTPPSPSKQSKKKKSNKKKSTPRQDVLPSPNPYIRVYLDSHTYWTVPVTHHSTAKEVCDSVAHKLERGEEAFELHDVDLKTASDKRLDGDHLISMLQMMWGDSEHRLVVKEISSFSPLKATREFMKKEGIIDNSADSGRNRRLSLSVQQLQKLTGIPNEWAIDPADLEITEKISAGASSRVFKGFLRKVEVEVALKIMRASQEEDFTETFQKEVQICTSVKDPNVVKFYGACLLPPAKICLVLEYCAKGNLHSVMKEKSLYFGWDMFFSFAIGIVRGINALHSCNPVIVHRDIKSQNLLVCENWDVKICDFGLSRTANLDNNASLGKLRGTYTYCPPEIYFGEKYTAKSDIFSLGIVLWELVARCIYGVHNNPFAEFKDGINFEFQVFIQTAKNGLRPTLPTECPPSLKYLINWMWQSDPPQRPNSLQVLDKLSAIQRDYITNKSVWDLLITTSKHPTSPSLPTPLSPLSPPLSSLPSPLSLNATSE